MADRHITSDIAAWAAAVTFDDIPSRVIERTKAQILSVAGAIHASGSSEGSATALDVARTWGDGSDATALATGERLHRHQALFANACASVALDFDDYLFAGHTGHSAVCTALAYGQSTGASGRDVLAAMTVANEVGGRLGASLLLGPHNGQMWAYIHQLEAACVAGRLLGANEQQLRNAIGIAFTQPVYPLVPAFMGPDSKMLLPASTSVEGARAAELAMGGWTGSSRILEDREGFLARFNENNLGFLMSGFGEAWVSDALTYKIYPGCAYIDTAVDALHKIQADHRAEHGRPLATEDVSDIHVRCGLFTMAMEDLCRRNREPGELLPISVNFSVALSFGVILTLGSLDARHLSKANLAEHAPVIDALADRVRLEHEPSQDIAAARATEASVSLTMLLGADDAARAKGLDGATFENHAFAFPADVTVTTTDGTTWQAEQDEPLGSCGRPWNESQRLVADKFTAHAPHDEALDAVASMDEAEGIDDVVALLAR